jgi:hypothetical protein
MSKLIEVTDIYNKSKFLINTKFIIRSINMKSVVNGENATEVTVQYGDQVVQHKIKETLDELYDLANYD